MKSLSILLAILAITLNHASADTIKEGSLAALSSDDLSEAVDYLVQKDRTAFLKLLVSGRVIITKASEEAVLTDSKLGMVQVRPRGSTIKFWVLSESLERN